jgi:xylose isomerase
MWKEWKDELPTLAGVALVVIALTAVVAKWDVSAPEAVLAMFGAALVATPVIAKIKIGSGGVEFETKVQETTSNISDVLDQHGKAIKTINDSLIQMNGSLDELHSSQKTLAAEIAKTPAFGAIANQLETIAAAEPKTGEISRALAANDAVLAAASDIRRKLKQSLSELH